MSYPTRSRYYGTWAYTVNQVGTTRHGSGVEVDVHLGQPGINAAINVIKLLDVAFEQRLADLFARCVFAPQKFTCSIMRSHANGAVHIGAGSPFVYVGNDYDGAAAHPVLPDPHLITALFLCEAVEVYGATSGVGWESQWSHGESLSRTLGATLMPGVLDAVGIQSAAAWMNTPGRPDWVSKSELSEVDPVSCGCGVAFLHYLNTVLHKPWPEIVAATGGNLEAKFNRLTGRHGGYAEMMAVLNKKHPPGVAVPNTMALENPFL